MHDVLPVNTLPHWEEVMVNSLFGLLAFAALIWAISVWVREKKKYALATQCIGGGQGIATVLEAL